MIKRDKRDLLATYICSSEIFVGGRCGCTVEASILHSMSQETKILKKPAKVSLVEASGPISMMRVEVCVYWRSKFEAPRGPNENI
jgi:hypothetical protein